MAVQEIDIGAEDIMETAVKLARGMFGLASYRELRDLPVDEYLALIDEVNRQVRESEREADAERK